MSLRPGVGAPATPTGPWLSHSRKTVADDAVGIVLRQWRLVNGVGQEAIAAALHVTRQHVSLIEHGDRPLSVAQRRTLVERLGIAPETLGLSRTQLSGPGARDDTTDAVAASRSRWRAEREWMNAHRSRLARLAAALYPQDHRVPRTPLIADPSWRLERPTELAALQLSLDVGPQAAEVTGAEEQTRAVRPLRADGIPFDRYTAAVRALSPPRLFESRPSYRLLAADLAAGRLGFGLGAYFDKLDTAEALGHELAAACVTLGRVPDDPGELGGRLPFRDLIADPFDLDRRAVIPAITTLTIKLRRYPDPPVFLLHWRDPASVATAAGIYDVVPAGEFQPSSTAPWDLSGDFDLWKNIVREYSEELLGEPEHDGTRSAPIDYAGWSLYRDLAAARQAGTVRASLLGVGMDALTLAATILTVVVIDEPVFDRLFGRTVTYNDEGEIVGLGDGRPADGIPFTDDTIDRLLATEPLASPGAACLALAQQYRDQVLNG